MTATTDLFENVSDLSFDIAVPTLNPAEMGGATGSISFSTSSKVPYPQRYIGKSMSAHDEGKWTVFGRIIGATWGVSPLSVQADTNLQRLNVVKAIPPSYGVPLNEAMDDVVALAGMTTSGLGTAVTSLPGWKGTILDYLKHFCAVYNMEYCISGDDPDTVVFRGLWSNTFSGNVSDMQYTESQQVASQYVEVMRYAYRHPTGGGNIELTPANETDSQILSVNAGEVSVVDIQLNAWVRSVNQPVCSSFVGPEERTDNGVYQILGSDGLPVTPETWVNQGGSLEVSMTDDPTIIRVTITAPDAVYMTGHDGDTRPSPYSVAVSAGNEAISALHITGTAIVWRRDTIRIATGADPDIAYDEVGTTVDNPFVCSPELSWAIGLRAAQAYGGSMSTCSFGTPAAQFGAVLELLGSKVLGPGRNYRVSSVNYAASAYSTTCEGSTTMADFDAIWGDSDMADFDAAWAGDTLGSFDKMPLVSP